VRNHHATRALGLDVKLVEVDVSHYCVMRRAEKGRKMPIKELGMFHVDQWYKSGASAPKARFRSHLSLPILPAIW
jgi:site-specific recombinase XerC